MSIRVPSEQHLKLPALVMGDIVVRRRLDAEQSRILILDAAERIMRREGYASVTTRRVADEAGLKAPLVHYHFATTDNLLLAFYRRSAERTRERLERALASNRPLHALWELNIDPERSALAADFIAMANHRKEIRTEIARNVTIFRQMQSAALDRILDTNPAIRRICPPEVAAVVIAAIARALVAEEAIDVTSGHEATRTLVEWFLNQLEKPESPEEELQASN